MDSCRLSNKMDAKSRDKFRHAGGFDHTDYAGVGTAEGGLESLKCVFEDGRCDGGRAYRPDNRNAAIQTSGPRSTFSISTLVFFRTSV